MLHFFYIWLHDDQGMTTPVDGSFAVEHIENSTGLEVSMHLHLKYPEDKQLNNWNWFLQVRISDIL